MLLRIIAGSQAGKRIPCSSNQLLSEGSAATASLSTADGVTFFVSGTHAYATKGTFTMTVRVADSGGFVANPVTTTATVGADD